MRAKVVFTLVALLLVSSLYDRNAHAEAKYLDSSVQYSTVKNCFQNYQEYGMGVYVGYLADSVTRQPAVGDVYYAHIVVSGLGFPCSQRAYVEINLPPNTTLAIDNVNKVYCFLNNSADPADCPTSLEKSAFNSNSFAIFAPKKPGNLEGYWGVPNGTIWEFQVPLRSTQALANQTLKATIRALDGNSSPWLQPSLGVTVFAADPSIQYPSPSTDVITPNLPCTDGGQCQTDTQCGPARICNCGQSFKSKANLNTRGLGGTFYFDLGDSQNYGLFSDQVTIPSNMTTYEAWSDWLPFKLQPGKTYHWRGRFLSSNQRTHLGVDQTFVTRNTKSWCASNVVVSKTFPLDQMIEFTGTSITTGIEGAYVDVTGSETVFDRDSTRKVNACFDFETWHLAGFSEMAMDVRFLLDGQSNGATTQRFDNTVSLKLCRELPLAVGSHNIKVQVRSVLKRGPPAKMRICGNSHGANQCSPNYPPQQDPNPKAEWMITVLP